MRIASLLASATEIVGSLGLQDDLVAISHECDHPPEVLDRPRVSRPRFDPRGMHGGAIDAAVREAAAAHGSVYELDADRLRALRPDLILTQGVCEVCAVATPLAQGAARLVDGAPTVLSLDAHTVAEVLESVVAVGRAAGVPERAGAVVRELERRIGAVRDRVAGVRRPRVLALEWLDPPYVPGHWTPEVIALAGGECLAGAVGGRSRAVGWEDLADLDPDAVILMPCGLDVAAGRGEAERQRPHLERTAPRAVGAGKAWVVDGSAYFNRSGPRMVDGIEMLAALLHPGRFPTYDAGEHAAPWP